jgi:hypothetical protein
MDFAIGDWVSVAAESWPKSGYGIRRIIRLELRPPAIGQVCGAKRVFTGKIDFIDPQENGERFLAVEKSHFFWLVRFGMLNKPKLVHQKDLSRCGAGVPLPLLQLQPFPWSDNDREMQREAAREMPRDINGRFSKLRRKENSHVVR